MNLPPKLVHIRRELAIRNINPATHVEMRALGDELDDNAICGFVLVFRALLCAL